MSTARLTKAMHQIAEITVAGSADAEADAMAAIERRSVHVIFLDSHLRQGTGLGVMRALATAQRKPLITAMTNNDLPEYRNAEFGLGATYFWDKARDYGRLPTVLYEICDAVQHSKHY